MFKILLGIFCLLLLFTPQAVSFSAPPTSTSVPATATSSGGPLLKLRNVTFDPLQNAPAKTSITNASNQPTLLIVQFNGPILADWRKALTSLGLPLYEYLPDWAYLTRMTSTQAATIAAWPEVRWVGPYLPAYKLDPALQKATGSQPLVIQVLPDESATSLQTALAGAGLKFQPALPATSPARLVGTLKGLRSIKVTADASLLSKLTNLDVVAWIEPDSFHPQPTNENAAWITQSGQFDQYPIWNMGITGAGPNPHSDGTIGTEQIVAISDTGVYLAHQDFAGPSAYPNSKILSIYNWGLIGGSTSMTGTDSYGASGHGTHVAGTIAGSGAASGGLHKGMAYGARLYVQQLGPSLDYFSSSIVTPVATLMNDAWQHGAYVQNNSWGDSDPGDWHYDTFVQEPDDFMWNHPYFLGVWSAGNSGPNPGTIYSPSLAKNILTVGASYNYTNYSNSPLDQLPSYSSRGPTRDGRVKPDLVAPGDYLVSDASNTTNGYFNDQGTSMAAPVTAGSAALVRDWYIHWLNYATPQAALVKATLINSATYLNATGGNLPDNNQGWGRILLQNVITPTNGTRFVYDDNPTGLETGEYAYYSYQVTDTTKPFKITLAWTDAPGTPVASNSSTSPELVNDLDLSVLSPDGKTYIGNQLQGQYSTINGAADRANNVEGVTVQNPATGWWRVRVRGYNIPNGPQPFALAITGPVTCQIPIGVVTDSTDNTNNNCNQTLRQVLNASGPNDTIDLTEVTGATIYPRTALPALQSGQTITATCSIGHPTVALSGQYVAGTAAGLALPAASHDIKINGLTIINFGGPGIDVSGSNHILTCNRIGTPDGLTPAPNGTGITVESGASGIRLGSPGVPKDGNLVSGNAGAGLYFNSPISDITLYGNWFGLKITGAAGLPNGGPALRVPAGVHVVLQEGNRFSQK